jgi:hypothetical protein
MNRKIALIMGGVAIMAIGGFFLWQHFSHRQTSSSIVVSPTIPDISTPNGWYSWGKGIICPALAVVLIA